MRRTALNPSRRGRRLCFGIPSLALLLFLPFLLKTSQALAAAPITPSGLNTQVNLSQTPPGGKIQYDITGGTRPGGGANLFHSFGDFNVPNHNIANFLNDSGVATSNILGRVTGGNISNIFGTIQTTGFGNANLFLMNPAGFLFGPNATANAGGMVAFTSADYLRLVDGARFNAIPNATADALLSASPVAAFGFLGSNPGAITVQGSKLSVTPEQSISLVGGNITVQSGVLDDGTPVQPARLSALGGQINLASVASPGEILAGTLAQAPNINGQSFGNLGTIQVSEQSVIDVNGNGGGTVLIRGGQFLLDNSTISANITGPGPVTNGVESIGGGIDIQVSQNAVIQNGSLIDTTVVGNATPGVQYGGVQIIADHIEVSGVADFANGILVPTIIQSNVDPGSTGGNAGHITFRANHNLDIRDFSVIQSLSQSATGDAGSINLTSTHGNISLTNNTIITSQTVDSPGTVGNITLSAPGGDILLADAIFFTYLQPPLNAEGVRSVRAGGSGEVEITANNLQMIGGDIGVINLSTLQPGDVTVTLAGNLSLHSGFLVPNSSIHTSTVGPAPAAGLTIIAHDILITEGSSLSTQTVGQSTTVTSGSGGVLKISADALQLTNGGTIRSGSELGIDPDTGLPGLNDLTGPGGTVSIQGHAGPARSILIDGPGSGIFTNAQGTGAGGNINILANTVTLQNGGQLSAATSGTAPTAIGGAIMVDATSTFSMTGGATITASSTGPGNAGNIQINAGNQFAMTNSSVTTQANQASGGTIKITTDPNGTVQLTNSMISASVLDGTSGGGSVNIDPQFVILQNSQILAQAVQGPGGNIAITTNLLLPDANSVISASSQFGVNGTVTIQSPNAPASGKIQPLGKSPLLATTLLNQRCAALAGGEFSSFTVAGRDSLPAEPGSWLASPMALASENTTGTVTGGRTRVSQSEPAGETPLLSLRQIAPAGFLTQAFAVDWSAGCTS